MDSAFEKQVERFDVGVKIVNELYATQEYALDAILSAVQSQKSSILDQFFKQEKLESAAIRTQKVCFLLRYIQLACFCRLPSTKRKKPPKKSEPMRRSASVLRV